MRRARHVARRMVLAVSPHLLAGCSGGLAAGGHDAGSGRPDSGGGGDSGVVITPGCPSVTDASLPSYETVAGGTLTGSQVSATICDVDMHVYVSPYTMPPDRVLLFIDSAGSGSGAVREPPDATPGLLVGTLAVTSAAPGIYSSSDPSACGGVSYEFYLPVPAGVDCDAGSPPNCPKYCATACSSQGCLPCTPQPPAIDYGATLASDCLGETQTAAGSWKVTLTSVTPAAMGGGYYEAHGSLSADVVGGELGSSTATLSLTF